MSGAGRIQLTMKMWMRDTPTPPVTHVNRLLLLLSLALLLPSGAHGDILGVAETLGCKLRSHEAGARDETPELLASLIDYGCYCNIGRLEGNHHFTRTAIAPLSPVTAFVTSRDVSNEY